jgi:trans-aconitate 2-methyltransferase
MDDSRQYLKFEDERTRPPRDLLAHVPLERARRVVDLGCGPGNSTALLIERYPQAAVIGIDSSPDMLRQARERLPACRFVNADIATWTPEAATDLLFANAVFQWLPDHTAEAYYDLLRPHCTRIDIWHSVYNHLMASPPAIVEWFKGSSLQPFLSPLDGAGKVSRRLRGEDRARLPAARRRQAAVAISAAVHCRRPLTGGRRKCRNAGDRRLTGSRRLLYA